MGDIFLKNISYKDLKKKKWQRKYNFERERDHPIKLIVLIVKCKNIRYFSFTNSSEYYHLYLAFFILIIELINISIDRDCNKKHGD